MGLRTLQDLIRLRGAVGPHERTKGMASRRRAGPIARRPLSLPFAATLIERRDGALRFTGEVKVGELFWPSAVPKQPLVVPLSPEEEERRGDHVWTRLQLTVGKDDFEAVADGSFADLKGKHFVLALKSSPDWVLPIRLRGGEQDKRSLEQVRFQRHDDVRDYIEDMYVGDDPVDYFGAAPPTFDWWLTKSSGALVAAVPDVLLPMTFGSHDGQVVAARQRPTTTDGLVYGICAESHDDASFDSCVDEVVQSDAMTRYLERVRGGKWTSFYDLLGDAQEGRVAKSPEERGLHGSLLVATTLERLTRQAAAQALAGPEVFETHPRGRDGGWLDAEVGELAAIILKRVLGEADRRHKRRDLRRAEQAKLEEARERLAVHAPQVAERLVTEPAAAVAGLVEQLAERGGRPAPVDGLIEAVVADLIERLRQLGHADAGEVRDACVELLCGVGRVGKPARGIGVAIERQLDAAVELNGGLQSDVFSIKRVVRSVKRREAKLRRDDDRAGSS